MPLVNSEVMNILKDKRHDYTQLTQDELLKTIAAASSQDAGNYGGQFVGFCAYMELVRQENRKNEKLAEALTLNSIKISRICLYVAVVSTIIAIISIFLSKN